MADKRKCWPVASLAAFFFALSPAWDVRGGDRRNHVLFSFEFGPEVCAAIRGDTADDTLRMQMSVLDLGRGTVYFHEDVALKRGAEKEGRRCGYKKLLLLKKGKFLVEALLYKPGEDRWGLEARAVEATGSPGGDATVNVAVDELRYDGFRHRARELLWDGDVTRSAFGDHMLWFRVKAMSLRPLEAQPELFCSLKMQTANLQIEKFMERVLGFDPEKPHPQYLWPRYEEREDLLRSVAVERVYNAAIAVDNLGVLSGFLTSGYRPPGKTEREVLKAMLRQTQNFRNAIQSGIDLVNWDKRSEEGAWAKLSDREKCDRIREMVGSLGDSMKWSFFGAEPPAGSTKVEKSPAAQVDILERSLKSLKKGAG